jgi:hypothetical protein
MLLGLLGIWGTFSLARVVFPQSYYSSSRCKLRTISFRALHLGHPSGVEQPRVEVKGNPVLA